MGEEKNGVLSKETPIKIRIDLLILLAALLISVGANVAVIKYHISDCSIHHELPELDARYMSKESAKQSLDELMRIADRIETGVKDNSRRIEKNSDAINSRR